MTDRFLTRLIFGLLIISALVNLIGALGPEVGFDALWYHLTLPKLWLTKGFLLNPPGDLLFPGLMPRLTEVFYYTAIKYGNYHVAKLLHYFFGLLSALVTYKIACKLTEKKMAIMAALIFYSSLVVGWLSISAYVDLSRTFFELLSFNYLIIWWQLKKDRYLVYSGLLMGLAISTKYLSLISATAMLIIILVLTKKVTKIVKYIASLSISLPWFIIAWKQSGNPLSPYNQATFQTNLSLIKFSPLNFITDIYKLNIAAQDPTTPIFFIFIPLVIIWIWQNRKSISSNIPIFLLFAYSTLTIIGWYMIPSFSPETRYVVPYIPIWAILISIIVQDKIIFSRQILKYSLLIIISLCILQISYRLYANKKYISFLLGKQTEQSFLTVNLPFQTNVFYDVDNYFKENIQPNQRVLVVGTHNLFYIDFPYEHISWANQNERFDYLLLQNSDIPPGYFPKDMIYNNSITGIKLYRL